MKQVSDSYKATMDMIIRPTTQFRATLNMSDSTIPKESAVQDNKLSFATGIFDTVHECDYITLEEDFFQVGGSQRIAPTSNPLANGYVSTVIAGVSGIFSAPPNISIAFNGQKRFSTVTYTFVGAYPTDIQISTYLNNTLVEQREVYPTGLSFEDIHNYAYCDRVELTFPSLSVGEQRLRIAKIVFGAVKNFTTADLISLTQNLEIDPLSSSLPVNEVTIKLNNIDKTFDPDNPSSDWEYFENGQQLSMDYGIYINGETELEWVPGATLLLSDTPTVDKASVTFKASDQLSFLTDAYNGGHYEPSGISMYDLAVEVFADADITRYVIDEALRDIYTVAPLPAIPQRECLQLIANASCAILYTDVYGVIHIERETVLASRISTSETTPYSDPQSIISGYDNITYITLEQNRWRVGDNRMLIAGQPYKRVGFVSEQLTDSSGQFDVSDYPQIVIQYGQPVKPHSIKLYNDSIGGVSVGAVTVTYYLGDTVVDPATGWEFDPGEYFELPISDAEQYDRVVVDITALVRSDGGRFASYLRARIIGIDDGLGNDYYLDFSVVYDPPIVKKTELLSVVAVSTYTYSEGTENQVVFEEDVTPNGTQTIYAIYPASTGLSVSATGLTVVESELNSEVGIITVSGTSGKVTVTGKPLNVKESTVLTRQGTNGEQCPINNPLITSAAVAKSVGEWVAGYLSHRNTYQVSFREDFRLDPADKIFIKSNFAEHIPARVTKLQYNLPGPQGSIAVRGLN